MILEKMWRTLRVELDAANIVYGYSPNPRCIRAIIGHHTIVVTIPKRSYNYEHKYVIAHARVQRLASGENRWQSRHVHCSNRGPEGDARQCIEVMEQAAQFRINYMK